MKANSIILLTIASLTMSITCGVNFSIAQEVDKGPAEITLSDEGNKPVLLQHHAHIDIMKCDECHKSPSYVPYADQYTKETGHGLCKDCHDNLDWHIKCGDCHIKSSKK